VAVALAALALVACTKGKTIETPGATLGTAAPTTTTTDPYAVPNPIDAAYVNRVLAGLDGVLGDALRLVVASRTIPREAADRIKSLYGTDQLLNVKVDGLSVDVAKGLPTAKPQPGNVKTTVVDLLSAKPTCIYAKVARDYSATTTSPLPSLATQWVAVVPLDPRRDPSLFNPTRWAYIYEGFERGFVAPTQDPCAAF
jgi:hypothetical protein